MADLLKDKKNKWIMLLLAAAWFYIIPSLYQFVFVNNDNPQKVIARVEKNITEREKSFNTLSKNTDALAVLANNTYSLKFLELYSQYPFSFQVHTIASDSSYSIRFWNNNVVIANERELHFADGKYVVNKDNGIYEFIKKTIPVKGSVLVLTGFIPVRWEYFIETEYLKKSFAASKNIERKFTLSQEPTIYAVKNNEGTVLMYLKKTTELRNTNFNWVYILCRILTLFFILWFIYDVCIAISKQKSFYIAFSILFLSLLALRLLAYYLKFPIDYTSIEYFDPRIYAANSIFRSLGDLTFNLIFSYLLLLFCIRFNNTKVHYTDKKRLRLDILKIFAFTVGTFYAVWLFRSIIAASTISFNVTNFFSLNIYSILGFLHIAFIVVIYYVFTLKWIRLHELLPKRDLLKYLLVAVFGLVILFLDFPWANDKACIWVLLWMLFYTYVSRYLYKSDPELILQMHIKWLLFFSFFSCILFNYEINKKEFTQRKFFAQKLAFKSDPSTENLLSIALSRFDNNFLRTNISKFYNAGLAVTYKDSLLSENFVGYLNKFETKIFTYDSLENPLFNTDSAAYQTFNAIIQNQGNRIPTINDLYYYEVSFDQFRYIYKKRITDTAGKTIGHFIVQANPLSYKNKSAALSPELFKQRNASLDENGNNYVFAIYNNLILRKRFVEYDLPTTIDKSDIPTGEDTIKYRNGYEELWLKLSKDSVVVIGKKSNFWIVTITLFAWLFFFIFFLVLFLITIGLLFSSKFNREYLKLIFQLNFSKQVQAIIWVVSLLTFIIVAVVIISLFKTRFNKSNKERLSRTMSILIADVQNKLNDNAIFDDIVKVYEPGANEALKETIFQMSEIHNVDFNIYDLEGTLKLSSQPFIESKGILSNKMDPDAFYYLNRNASAQYVQQEKIGDFAFLSMYVPIRDEKGKAYGYLNIPYYSSEKDLNQEISNFLITIINLNAFIFLIAGLIAWLVTNRITNSFQLIGNKMKAVNLGKNEMIEWNKNDEIGGLVNEYNKMVLKLEASAASLAKSEREGAWREMARQVAHEIKNPLTPMKLSIQYLQKSIENGSENVKELTTKVSQTLVEQIDHLSSIASDFSQFANIQNLKIEKLDLLPILNSLQMLFGAEHNAEITLHVEADNTMVMADKTQMNRLFTNLIKNAIQAYEPDQIKKIEIAIQNLNAEIIITVKDNAKGIPEHLQEKIFTPNFTTKSSGTGLGLAISKDIVEQNGGTISFTTKENVGTVFTIQLPVINI